VGVLTGILGSQLLFVSCGRNTIACGAPRIEPAARYSVASYYGRWSYASDHCSESTPKELVIDGNGYALRVYLMANQNPRFFLGIEPRGSDQFRFVAGGKFATLTGLETALFPRYTHSVAISDMATDWRLDRNAITVGSNVALAFSVINVST